MLHLCNTHCFIVTFDMGKHYVITRYQNSKKALNAKVSDIPVSVSIFYYSYRPPLVTTIKCAYTEKTNWYI